MKGRKPFRAPKVRLPTRSSICSAPARCAGCRLAIAAAGKECPHSLEGPRGQVCSARAAVQRRCDTALAALLHRK